MAGKTEISPSLEEFAKAIAHDTDVDLASIVLKDCLKKAHVREIAQMSVTKEIYGVRIYMRANNGHEAIAKVTDVNGKYTTIRQELDTFVKNYNKPWFP
jgi:hypothetical protein